MSGGLRPAVLVLARTLGIPDARVHAVDVRYDADGSYVDFDRDSPLCTQLGKLRLMRELGLDARRTAFVGDGSTDLVCAQASARFIAFAGVARRPAVVAAARVVVDEADFRALAPLLLSAAERAELAEDPAYRTLVTP